MFSLYSIDTMMVVSNVWLYLIVTQGEVVYITRHSINLYNLKSKDVISKVSENKEQLIQLIFNYLVANEFINIPTQIDCYWKRSCSTTDFQLTYILLQKVKSNSRRSWHCHNSSLRSTSSYESNHWC